MEKQKNKKYISVYAICKCGHQKRYHNVDGNPKRDKKGNVTGMYFSCGLLSYPIWFSGALKVGR